MTEKEIKAVIEENKPKLQDLLDGKVGGGILGVIVKDNTVVTLGYVNTKEEVPLQVQLAFAGAKQLIDKYLSAVVDNDLTEEESSNEKQD